MTKAKLAIAATIFMVLALFLLAEVGLRLYQKVASNVPVTSFLPGYKDKRFPLSPFLVFGPRIDWQIPGKKQPHFAYFNSQGFRIQGVVGIKPKGEYRIVTLGGSTTEDVWNEEGIHWPLVLEQRLHSLGHPDVRVLNSAMSAYTTAHTLVRLAFDITEHAPDMVIVMHNINDLMVNYQAALQSEAVDPHYKVLYGTKRFTGDVSDEDVVLSRVFHAITSRVQAWQQAQFRPVVTVDDISTGKRIFKRNLANIITLAQAHRIRVVLLTMPFSRSTHAYETSRANGRPFPQHQRLLSDMETYNDAIREVGKDRGVTVIDMARHLPDDEDYFVDIVHYSTAGVRAFGQGLAPRLSEAIDGKRTDNKGR